MTMTKLLENCTQAHVLNSTNSSDINMDGLSHVVITPTSIEFRGIAKKREKKTTGEAL